MVDGEFFFLYAHVSFFSRNNDGCFALPGHQTTYYIIVVCIVISTFGRRPRRAFSPVDSSRSLFRSVSLSTRVGGTSETHRSRTRFASLYYGSGI